MTEKTTTTDDLFPVTDFERDILAMGTNFYEHSYLLVPGTTALLAAVNVRFEELTPANRERMDYRRWAFIRPPMSADDPRRPFLPWCRHLDNCTALLWELVEDRRFRECLDNIDEIRGTQHPRLPKHLPLSGEETIVPKFFGNCFCLPRSIELLERAIIARWDAADESERKWLDRWHQLLSSTSQELKKLFNDKTFKPQIIAYLAEQDEPATRPRL